MRFSTPTTVAEAVGLLAEPTTVILAGGMSVVIALKQRRLAADHLVWLGKIAELTRIEQCPRAAQLTMGATVTLLDIARSELIARHAPMLASAAEAVGNPRVRAAATIGGSIANADPRQDLLPPLLALDARAHLRSREGVRQVSLRHGFFRGSGGTAIASGEILTGVSIPADVGARQRYLRFAPDSPDDLPTVAIAARATISPGGRVKSADLALGGVASVPLSIPGVDRELAAPRPAAASIAAVTALVRTAVAPVDDVLGPADYKTEMSTIFTERILSELLG